MNEKSLRMLLKQLAGGRAAQSAEIGKSGTSRVSA